MTEIVVDTDTPTAPVRVSLVPNSFLEAAAAASPAASATNPFATEASAGTISRLDTVTLALYRTSALDSDTTLLTRLINQAPADAYGDIDARVLDLSDFDADAITRPSTDGLRLNLKGTTLVGPGGASTGQYFLNVNFPLWVEGGTFEGWPSVNLGTEAVPDKQGGVFNLTNATELPYFILENVRADTPGSLLRGTTTTAKVAEITLNGCEVDGASHIAVHVANAYDHFQVTKGRYTNSRRRSFLLGANTYARQTEWKAAHFDEVYFYNIQGTAAGEGALAPSPSANAMQVYGLYANIHDCHIEKVTNDSKEDCEAIYLKTLYYHVKNNTIINGGWHEAWINIKGQPRSSITVPQGFVSEVSGNILRATSDWTGTATPYSGIHVACDDAWVHHNTLEGFREYAIYTKELTFNNVRIEDNRVFNHLGAVAYRLHHIGNGLRFLRNTLDGQVVTGDEPTGLQVFNEARHEFTVSSIVGNGTTATATVTANLLSNDASFVSGILVTIEDENANQFEGDTAAITVTGATTFTFPSINVGTVNTGTLYRLTPYSVDWEIGGVRFKNPSGDSGTENAGIVFKPNVCPRDLRMTDIVTDGYATGVLFSNAVTRQIEKLRLRDHEYLGTTSPSTGLVFSYPGGNYPADIRIKDIRPAVLDTTITSLADGAVPSVARWWEGMFEMVGTTAITGVTGMQNGDEVWLRGNGSRQITNGANIRLRNNISRTPTINELVHLKQHLSVLFEV